MKLLQLNINYIKKQKKKKKEKYLFFDLKVQRTLLLFHFSLEFSKKNSTKNYIFGPPEKAKNLHTKKKKKNFILKNHFQ